MLASRARAAAGALSEEGVRLAQKTQVGPCIPVEIQLEKAEVGPTSGPTWRLSHLGVVPEPVAIRRHHAVQLAL